MGGTEVVSTRVEDKITTELKNMNIHGLKGGRFALGSNDEGFVIQQARITFSGEDYFNDVDKNLEMQVKEAKVFFGIDL